MKSQCNRGCCCLSSNAGRYLWSTENLAFWNWQRKCHICIKVTKYCISCFPWCFIFEGVELWRLQTEVWYCLFFFLSKLHWPHTKRRINKPLNWALYMEISILITMHAVKWNHRGCTFIVRGVSGLHEWHGNDSSSHPPSCSHWSDWWSYLTHAKLQKDWLSMMLSFCLWQTDKPQVMVYVTTVLVLLYVTMCFSSSGLPLQPEQHFWNHLPPCCRSHAESMNNCNRLWPPAPLLQTGDSQM